MTKKTLELEEVDTFKIKYLVEKVQRLQLQLREVSSVVEENKALLNTTIQELQGKYGLSEDIQAQLDVEEGVLSWEEPEESEDSGGVATIEA